MNIFRSKITPNQKGVCLIGEALIDIIFDQNSNDKKIIVGGSPTNIAFNLNDLNIPNIHFFGTVGNDDFGKMIIDEFMTRKLSTKGINIHHKETSIVKINRTPLSPHATFFRDADKDISFTYDLKECIQNTAILHFSYWPLSTKLSRETVLRSIKLAKKLNMIIGFDPNIHPLLLNDECPSFEELLEIIKHVDIIKPSFDDAVRLFGEGYKPIEYIKMFSDLGVKLVVMTLGKDGLIASYSNHIYVQESLAKEIVDATGAGDAFYSGMYAAILNDEEIEDILKIGSLCSAHNLKVVGGFSNLPNYDILKESIK